MRGLLSGKEPCSVRSTDANVGQKGFKTGHALEKRSTHGRVHEHSLMGYFKLWLQREAAHGT